MTGFHKNWSVTLRKIEAENFVIGLIIRNFEMVVAFFICNCWFIHMKRQTADLSLNFT